MSLHSLFLALVRHTEFKSFDRQLAVEAAAQFSDTGSRTIQKTVESMLFTELNEDTYMPMNIMAMVELSDCTSVCGGIYAAEQGTDDAVQSSLPEENKDTCIAVAGLPSNNTVMVKKYCVPKAQGRGVKLAPTETWFIWFSEVSKNALQKSNVLYHPM